VTFGRSLALRALSELLAKGSSVVLVLAVARSLGSARFGVFSLAWATGWLLALASDMGTHMLAAREAARSAEPSQLAGGLLAAKAGLAAAGLALLGLLAPHIVDPVDGPVLWAIAGALLLLSFVDFVQHLLRGRGRFGLDAALQIASRAALLACGLGGLMLHGLHGVAAGLLAGGGLGAVAAAIALGVDCGRPRLGPQPGELVARLLGQALPIGAGIALTVVAFRMDLFLLGALAADRTVGLYAGAYRLFEAAQLLPAVLLMVLFPRLAATAGDPAAGAPLRRRALGGLAALGAAVAAGGSLAAPLLVEVLYGAAYEESSAPLAILFWAAPFMFVNALLTQDLIARVRQGRYALAAGGALAANLALNLLLIPRYGMSGAAVATIATEAVLVAGCLLALGGRKLAIFPGEPVGEPVPPRRAGD
jgi:O-antigen/teichoic acid export membrane protein